MTFKRELQRLYEQIEVKINRRAAEFRAVWERGDERELLCELMFCLLTPAARAHSAWEALQNLEKKGLILHETVKQPQSSNLRAHNDDERRRRIADELRTVRFKNNKARNVMEAERFFVIDGKVSVLSHLRRFHTIQETREWLAATVRGMGFKEASHFLRNIGRGQNIAILDRHILRCLKCAGVIDTVPGSLTAKAYVETEQRMKVFAGGIGIPIDHLDMLFWYHETGEIFK